MTLLEWHDRISKLEKVIREMRISIEEELYVRVKANIPKEKEPSQG